MKKLSVLFLATVFVFGLVVQAGAQEPGAQEQGPHVVLKGAFSEEDPVFNFDDFASAYDCSPGEIREPINFQYEQEFGVSFSGLLYGERFWSGYFFSVFPKLAASNFDICAFDASISGEPVVVEFNPPVTRVGFIGVSPAGGITVTPFMDGRATADPIFFNTPSGVDTFIGIEDSAGIDEIKIEGNGIVSGKSSIFWIDDFTFGGSLDTTPAITKVNVNIKPPDCLGARIAMDEKRINGKSKGVTPVVIMGDETYDVTAINPEKILLQGVEPVRWALEDAVHCNAEYGDGMLDLTLKFDTQQLVEAMRGSLDAEDLENLEDGMPVSLNLNLTGELYDSTPIENNGDLRVTIFMRGKHEHENRGRGPHPSEHDRGHHKGWDNNRGHHKGLHKNR